MGVHELMNVNDAVRGLIRKRAPAGELRALAMAQGMHTLRQDGLVKAFLGLTEVGEVMATTNSWHPPSRGQGQPDAADMTGVEVSYLDTVFATRATS